MSDHLDHFAQKAGEAFVAAGRAQTPEQRDEHRASAQTFQEIVSGIRKRRRRAKSSGS